MAKYIKVLAVGDPTSHKEELLLNFAKKFHERVEISVDGIQVLPALLSITGMECYERLRLMSYPTTDVFLICFAIDSPETFENVEKIWAPEIRQHSKKVPFFLVGNKVEKRENEKTILALAEINRKPITATQGQQMANRIGAIEYFECSSEYTDEIVDEIFTEAARAALQTKKKSKKRCVIS